MTDMGDALAERQRPLRRARGEGRKIDRAARVHRRKQPQRPAIAAGEVTPAGRAEQRAATLHGRVRAQTGAVNLPALAVDGAEGPGKWRRDRAHQVVNLERRPRPIDASVLRPPPAEVFAWQHRLWPARRGSGDE